MANSMKFAKPDEKSFEILLELVNGIKNEGSVLESKLYLALIYALYGIDNPLRYQDFPADPASLEYPNSKELYMANLAELFLYNKKMDKFHRILGTLEKISETSVIDVNDNPFYLHTRIAVLHAMAGDPPDYLMKTIKLIKKFPRRSPDTILSINNILNTIVDVIILSGDGKALLPEITDLLEMVPRNRGRDNMGGYIARKLCMRNEIEPTNNISCIEFAKDKLLPDIRDGTEIDFTKIQMAIALSRYTSSDRETSEEMKALSLSLINECESKLKNCRNAEEKTMIKFNLLRGYDQVGLGKAALSLKNDLIKDFNKDIEFFKSTMNKIETLKKMNNNRLPDDIAEIEDDTLEMAEGTFSAIPLSLVMAGHYSDNEQFALECLSDAENMSSEIPFMDLGKDILCRVAVAYAYWGMKDRSLKLFKGITEIISQHPEPDSTDEFMDIFTDNAGEAFQFAPEPELIHIWENLGKELKLCKSKHEESVKFLLNDIFRHKRTWFWNLSFSD